MTSAVAPPAPVSVSQGAAPPGSGPPSGAPPTSGPPFGSILDSARTAVAEGQKGTGTKVGDHSSNSKSTGSGQSDDGSQSSSSAQLPAGADVFPAAVALLTGQTPPPSPVGSKAGPATTAVADAGTASTTKTDTKTTGAAGTAGSPGPASAA